MGKGERGGRPTSRARRPDGRGRAGRPVGGPSRLRAALDAAPDLLLHPRTPDEPVWKLLWPVLGLAFAVRAAVALSGDFVLHPDEIMQYLEQGHRAAFGNGVIYWEFFYGARPWLVPGLVAGVLKLFAVAGLDQPAWYVGGVKLVFCAISLAVPAGMYFFARRHFDEAAARVALLAGAFWYELVGFAHKPLTGFVATSLLTALLALCLQPPRTGRAWAWLAALPAVLAAAIRWQYAPLALALLGVCFLRAVRPPEEGDDEAGTPRHGTARTGGRPVGRRADWRAGTQLALAAVVCFLAVGAIDAATWGDGPFHSYLTNFRFNAVLSEISGSADSPGWQYLRWLTVAGAGLSVLCAAAALRDLRRYGFLLALIALILVPHTALAHKEYRFIFAVVPLWLLVGADVAVRLTGPVGRAARALRGVAAKRRAVGVYGAAGAAFAAVSLAGILNALPLQHEVYAGAYAPGQLPLRFIGGHDPVFRAYRHLAEAPGVEAVWHVDRPYFNLPGYYYLHRKVPFYDSLTGNGHDFYDDLQAVRVSVSHIVTEDPGVSVPGYALDKEFGAVRVLRREAGEPPIRRWRHFAPTVTSAIDRRIMGRIDPDGPSPPADFGIRFAAPE